MGKLAGMVYGDDPAPSLTEEPGKLTLNITQGP